MINLKPFTGSSHDFIDEVISSKRNKKNDTEPCYKDRLVLLLSSIKEHYTQYDKLFSQNKLKLLCQNHQYNKEEEDDLQSLYKYSSKPFIELKNKILTLEDNRFLDTCQYCTLDSISTFDHIAPQSIFPQYVAHPKNLFPSCSICNGKKSKIWLNSQQEFKILNLYLNQLPEKQYLFVNVIRNDDTFTMSYYLDNKNNIDSELFNLIQDHYKNIDLLNRLGLKISGIFTELENSIKCALDLNIPLQSILISIENRYLANSKTTGFNYYKNVLELELSTNNLFREYLMEKYKLNNIS